MYLFKLLAGAHRGIASCRNSGMGDNLLAAASAWLYARQTGRCLSICWFHSRYLRDCRENAFSRFFALPKSIQDVPVFVEPRADRISAFVLMHWSYLVPFPDFLGILERVFQRTAVARHVAENFFPRGFAWSRRQKREEHLIRSAGNMPRRQVIASGCYSPVAELKPFFDALRLQPHLSARADAFAARHFHNKSVIGVHIRYYDPALPTSNHSASWADTEQALDLCRNRIEAAIQAVGSRDYVIFLSTDSRKVHEFICARLDHVVAVEKRWGVDPAMELHEELPVETAEATAVEMFLLAQSHMLIRLPRNSWFSHYASLYVGQVSA
jgi:Nodulation protein Z (NodZ)